LQIAPLLGCAFVIAVRDLLLEQPEPSYEVLESSIKPLNSKIYQVLTKPCSSLPVTEDIQEWLRLTLVSKRIRTSMLNKSSKSTFELGIIDKRYLFEAL
jgi:hypothetical protein